MEYNRIFRVCSDLVYCLYLLYLLQFFRFLNDFLFDFYVSLCEFQCSGYFFCLFFLGVLLGEK